MKIVSLSDWTVEHVSPVVLPLFPTGSPNEAAPIVAEGAAGEMLVVPTGPKSRIVPETSTCPGTISAKAASTLLGAWPQRAALDASVAQGPVVSFATGLSAAPWVRCATVSGGGAVGAVQASCRG